MIGSVARVPIEIEDLEKLPESGAPLLDAFDLDEKAVIHPAEDFTISINTVSRSLFEKYRSRYKAGEFGNNHFILLSGIGIGDQKEPTLKVHLVEPIDDIDNNDWLTIWAENIDTIEDYSVGEANSRIFLSFHAFCQNLGGSKQDDLKGVLTDILNFTGAMLPALTPFTSIGKVAVNGLNNILNKKINIGAEVKDMTFALYPADGLAKGIQGEAPLQTGIYILFAEKTDFTGLKLKRDGTVENSPNPYIVVNVKRGTTLAPDKLDAAAGAKILANFQPQYGFPISVDKGAPTGSLDELRELGRSYKLGQQTIRYFQLKKKPVRSDQENAKLAHLSQALKTAIPGFDSDT